MCHNFPNHNIHILLTYRGLHSTYFGLRQFCCKAGASVGHPKLPEIWEEGGGHPKVFASHPPQIC